jgi:hypothetical protein
MKAAAEGQKARSESQKWPRMRDLPENERAPFNKWLNGQTCPVIEGIPIEEQDAYYPWDYDRWKRGHPIVD